MTDRQAIEILTEEYRHVAIHLKDAGKSPEYYKKMQDLAHALTRGIEALEQRTPPEVEKSEAEFQIYKGFEKRPKTYLVFPNKGKNRTGRDIVIASKRYFKCSKEHLFCGIGTIKEDGNLYPYDFNYPTSAIYITYRRKVVRNDY